MKAIHAIKVAGSTLLIAASVHAYAQSSEAAPAAPATASTTHAARTQYKSMKAANRALQRQVRTALSRTRGVTVSNITVRAVDGAVTLQGSVPEQSQIDLAVEAAKGVQGVKSVRSALSIRPVGT
ncbi:BON domain-containing protein [Paraburkholderia sp. BL10I2N1]|uniref:BON domain-containing protein n=1 Tax=Paraburkholderia sp. BL10I2N1 TaxID=1938796 RepID=UPI00105D59ED|nr:BON domain-containing protein [Paraburkholderia sp. BL10I2N1]TDN61321.1 BON domain-containing protein [Paraburkholderia sp. BL10I2N1]